MVQKKRKSKYANRYAAPLGGVFIVLCVIGLINVVGLCFNFTRSILDNSVSKQAYATRLLPIVMFDPPPFEDPIMIPAEDILMYSIWSTILEYDREELQYDDSLSVIVSASEVDIKAFSLFGPDVKLTHGLISPYQSYYYVKETKSYHVPIDILTGISTPRVETINKKGDTIELHVGYVPPADILNVDLENTGNYESKPVKYMDYILKKGKTDYYLHAIREPVGGAVPGLAGPNGNTILEQPQTNGNSNQETLVPTPPIASSDDVENSSQSSSSNDSSSDDSSSDDSSSDDSSSNDSSSDDSSSDDSSSDDSSSDEEDESSKS